MRQPRLLNGLYEHADIGDEVLPRESIVEILGTRRVLIENHCGVYQYGDQAIGVRLRNCRTLICGCGLKLLSMTKERLVISGTIDGIQIIQGERH